MEFVRCGFKELLLSSLVLGVVYYASARAGGLVLKLSGLRSDKFSRSESVLFSVAVGLILLSLGVLILGLSGLLSTFSMRALVIGLFLIPLFFDRGREGLGKILSLKRPKIDRGEVLFFLLIGIAFFLSWAQTCAPPTGNDALAYHLAHPKEFILNEKISYLPFTRESLWPYLTEMLYTLALLLRGTTLAQAFHWSFYVLTAASIYSFAKRFYDPRVAKLATLVFVFTPVVFAQSSQAYVDLSVTFFIFAAVYAFTLADVTGLEKGAFLSGLMMGGALSTKYLALGAAAILLILWIFRGGRNLKPGLIFALASGLVSFVWYLRSGLVLQNPVYPFLPGLFGGHGYASSIGEAHGFGNGLLNLFLFGWNVTFFPNAFGGESIGPLFLMFLPLLVFFCQGVRRSILEVGIFTFLFGGLIFFQSQQVRFFISILPFLSLGAAVAVDRLAARRTAIRRVVFLTVWVVVMIHGAIFMYRSRDALKCATGKMSVSSYLEESERSYKAYRYLSAHAKPQDKIFNAGEVRVFYSDNQNMIVDGAPLRRFLADERMSVSQYLEKERFEHIWIQQDSDEAVKEFALSRPYKEAFYYQFTEKPKTFSNTLYRLQSD